MTVYDVSYATESHARMCLREDGSMIWTIDALWHAFWVDSGVQEAVEKIITADPSTTVFAYRGFTIRRRAEPPG